MISFDGCFRQIDACFIVIYGASCDQYSFGMSRFCDIFESLDHWGLVTCLEHCVLHISTIQMLIHKTMLTIPVLLFQRHLYMARLQ